MANGDKQLEPEMLTISFKIDKEIHERLKATVPYGVRSHFFRRILELALSRLEVGGYEVIGAIMAGDFDPLQAVREERENK